MTGQARIRTHILATPELESNALDRSATTTVVIEAHDSHIRVRLRTDGTGTRYFCEVHQVHVEILSSK